MEKTSKNKAFTLAEVLITLIIIGVIAALTIPTVISNVGQKHNRTALKKTFSVLSNAASMIRTENSGTLANLCSTNSCYNNLFKAKLSTMKVCSTGEIRGNCWAQSWKTLNNADGWNWDDYSSAGVVLQDGISIVFIWADLECDYSDAAGNPATECVSIAVDVNGLKSPNKMGYDIFRFYAHENRVVPYGSIEQIGNLTSFSCTEAKRGDACAAFMLQDIDYVIPPS